MSAERPDRPGRGETLRTEAAVANALGCWREIAGRLWGKRLALFLDYDGTLATIAPAPPLAVLTAATRSALETVARVWPTAIVSGRALEEIEGLVGVSDLVYAGSHGFDMRGPDGLRLEVAAEAEPILRKAAAELRRGTAHIDGVIVEEKRLAVALHFRQAAIATQGPVTTVFAAVLDSHPELEGIQGKSVLELRPAVGWGKGEAVRWLLRRFKPGRQVVPIYIGDDVTDEDAFRALGPDGLAIQVGRIAWSTCAPYLLADVLEVRQFLLRLAALAPRPAGAGLRGSRFNTR